MTDEEPDMYTSLRLNGRGKTMEFILYFVIKILQKERHSSNIFKSSILK